MTKKLWVQVFILGVISGAGFATPVDSVTADYIGMGAKSSLKIWGGGHSDFKTNAGAFIFDKTGDTGEGAYFDNGIISGFCMDLGQSVARREKTYELIMPEEGPRPTNFLGGPMGSVKAGYLSELWGRYYDSSWSDGGRYSRQENSDAEAFAAAIWEIIYEDVPGSSSGWDVRRDGTSGRGGFRAKGLDYSKANRWLASLDGTGPMAELRAISHDCVQDFLVEVPEPATVALFGMMGFYIMRKKRKPKT